MCTDSYSSHIYCPVRRQAMIIPTGRPVPKATKATLALRLGMCLCACVFICRRPGSLFLFPANSDCFYFALFALFALIHLPLQLTFVMLAQCISILQVHCCCRSIAAGQIAPKSALLSERSHIIHCRGILHLQKNDNLCMTGST